MNHRAYYWKAVKTQLGLTWCLFWNGVVCNRGHHSNWGRTWFFKMKK